MVTTIENCTFDGALLRSGCGRPAVTDCVYCARPFCQEHGERGERGERGEQYMDVCSRKRCRAKLLDLRAHDEWKARAGHANRVSVCAREDCEVRLRHECSRCRLLFCEDHVREMRVRDTSRQPAVQFRALVCKHCAQRHKLWR